MSYTFSRRDFLKYSAMTAVAVAGAGLLTGCEIQDPNNPVIKKLGYGTTLGTTGGLLKSVDNMNAIYIIILHDFFYALYNKISYTL